MKYFYLLTAIVFIVFYQSNTNPILKKGMSDSERKSKLFSNKQISNPESVQAVYNFLLWYKNNYDAINKVELINNTGMNADTSKYYSVNFNGTEKYLKMLKSSGYISEKYIEKWRKYFLEHDENFKKIRQNDGPPDGFEYDFVLLTQDDAFSRIDNPKLIDVKENALSSVVKIDVLVKLKFSLTKNNNKWQIDTIENLGYD